METKVLLTSPYHEVTSMASRVAKKLDIAIVVLDGALDEIMGVVRKTMAENNIKVILSRGATAAILKQHYPVISIVNIDPSEFDILEALAVAKSMGSKIGFLTSKYNKNHQKIKRIGKIVGVSVTTLLYGDTLEFANCINEAHHAGIDVLVGGGRLAQELASKKRIRCLPLIAGEDTLTRSLQRAKDIIEASRRESDRAVWFHTVVEYSHEGIMAVDNEQKFTLFNPAAEKVFGISEPEVSGRAVQDFSYLKSLNMLFEGASPNLGELCQTRNGTFVVNRVPVTSQGETRGTLVTFQNVASIQQLELRIRSKLHKSKFAARYSFKDMVYSSKAMGTVMEAARRFSSTDSTVLIHGESGTGKELLAQGMHRAHPSRQNGPFVALNCAALSETLIESELFGYEEGSFTGAKKGGRPGIFEMAHGGTIFLDEIAKMPLELQGSLLRVIQEKEIRRVGGDENIPIDVRVIAATNENLEEMVNQGKFRKDLYYRLKVLVIKIPPLRERMDDVKGLAYYFLSIYNQKYEKKTPLPKSGVKRLMQLSWPGNIRQLENFIERYVLIYNEEDKPVKIIEQLIRDEFVEKGGLDTSDYEDCTSLRAMEKRIIENMLETKRYKRAELAEKLGISRTTLWKILNGE